MASLEPTKVKKWLFIGSSIYKHVHVHVQKSDAEVQCIRGGKVKDITKKVKEYAVFDFDAVAVQIGSNDLCNKDLSIQDFSNEIEGLIKLILGKANEMKKETFELKIGSITPRLGQNNLNKTYKVANSEINKVIMKTREDMVARIAENNYMFKYQISQSDNDEVLYLKSGEINNIAYEDNTHLSPKGTLPLVEITGYNTKPNGKFENVILDKTIKISDQVWLKWTDIFEGLKEIVEPDAIDSLIKEDKFWIVTLTNDAAYQLVKEGINIKGKRTMVYNFAEEVPETYRYKLFGIPSQCEDNLITTCFERLNKRVINIERLKYTNTNIKTGEVVIKFMAEKDCVLPNRLKIANNVDNIRHLNLDYTKRKTEVTQNRMITGNTDPRPVQQRNKRACYICRGNRGDHSPSECPAAKACYRCHQKNHLIKDCRGIIVQPVAQQEKREEKEAAKTPVHREQKEVEETEEVPPSEEFSNVSRVSEAGESDNEVTLKFVSSTPLNKKTRKQVRQLLNDSIAKVADNELKGTIKTVQNVSS